jgi:hypothetical protein
MKIKQRQNLKKAEKRSKRIWEFKSEVISEYSNFDNKILQSVNQKCGSGGVINFLIRFVLPNDIFGFEGKLIHSVELIDSLTERDVSIIKKKKVASGYEKFNLNYDIWDGELKASRTGFF